MFLAAPQADQLGAATVIVALRRAMNLPVGP